MRSMIEVIEKMLADFEEGSAHHHYPGDEDEDPFTAKSFHDGCLAFNNKLYTWRALRRKYKAENATEEIKKQFVKETNVVYYEIVNRKSLGWIVTNKSEKFEETITLLEQRIETLKLELAKCKEEAKLMAKKAAQVTAPENSAPAPPKDDFRGIS